MSIVINDLINMYKKVLVDEKDIIYTVNGYSEYQKKDDKRIHIGFIITSQEKKFDRHKNNINSLVYEYIINVDIKSRDAYRLERIKEKIIIFHDIFEPIDVSYENNDTAKYIKSSSYNIGYNGYNFKDFFSTLITVKLYRTPIVKNERLFKVLDIDKKISLLFNNFSNNELKQEIIDSLSFFENIDDKSFLENSQYNLIKYIQNKENLQDSYNLLYKKYTDYTDSIVLQAELALYNAELVINEFNYGYAYSLINQIEDDSYKQVLLLRLQVIDGLLNTLDTCNNLVEKAERNRTVEDYSLAYTSVQILDEKLISYKSIFDTRLELVRDIIFGTESGDNRLNNLIVDTVELIFDNKEVMNISYIENYISYTEYILDETLKNELIDKLNISLTISEKYSTVRHYLDYLLKETNRIEYSITLNSFNELLADEESAEKDKLFNILNIINEYLNSIEKVKDKTVLKINFASNNNINGFDNIHFDAGLINNSNYTVIGNIACKNNSNYTGVLEMKKKTSATTITNISNNIVSNNTKDKHGIGYLIDDLRIYENTLQLSWPVFIRILNLKPNTYYRITVNMFNNSIQNSYVGTGVKETDASSSSYNLIAYRNEALYSKVFKTGDIEDNENCLYLHFLFLSFLIIEEL